MSLYKKILLSLLTSISFIAIINIASFYIFYSIYFKEYLHKKALVRESVTLEYINDIIKKQALKDVDNVFENAEIQFFELLEQNKWTISLNKKENIDIVINFLTQAWVSSKYIEEVIPQNTLEKIITNIKTPNTSEAIFFKNLIISIIITNIISIFILIIFILFFSKKITVPIKKAADKIKDVKLWSAESIIDYDKNDEIWLLVNAINWLNSQLNFQESIRNKLLADISHELKTPITSIQCYLEWINDKIIKLDENTLNSIISEMNRLVKLVNKIMEFEKFENSQITLHPENLNLKYLTQWVIRQFKQKLTYTNQKIITSWINKETFTDKDSFIQIVQNIISNFIKYAWNNTSLKIEFHNNYIEFRDNWKWISKTELPYIREKFYQSKIEKTGPIEDRWIWVWLSIIEKISSSLWWYVEIDSEIWKWFIIKIITKNSQ